MSSGPEVGAGSAVCAPAGRAAMASGKAAATAMDAFFRLCMEFPFPFLNGLVHCRDVEDLRLLHRQVHEGDRGFGHLRDSVLAVELVARANAVALLAALQEHGEL